MLVLPRHHTPWLAVAVVAIVIWALLLAVAMAVAQRRTRPVPVVPEESWLELIDQVPETATQLAPTAPSARLKLSVKDVTGCPPRQGVRAPAGSRRLR